MADDDENYFSKYRSKAAADDDENYFAKYRPKEGKTTSESAADMLVRFATGGAGIKHGLEKAGEHAKGLMTGEIPPTPENVVPAASMAMGVSPLPVRLGFKGPPGAGPIPWGPRATPEPVAPVAPTGPPTARTLGEIKEAGLEALLQPTGTIPSPGKAGSVVRQALEPRIPSRAPSPEDWMAQPGGPVPPRTPVSLDEWIYQAKAGTPSEEWIRRAHTPGDDWTAGLAPVNKAPVAPAPVEPVPKSVRDLLPGQGSDVMGHLHDLAIGKVEGGHAALGQIMRAVPEEKLPIVRGGFLNQLGGGAGVKGPSGFDPIVMVQRYGELSLPARGVIFGESGKSGIRTSMDSILNDYTKIRALNAKGASVKQPLDMLQDIIRQGNYGNLGHAVIRHLTSPSTAASVAQWSRALVKLIEKGKTPATIAALTIATRNLENTIGSAQAAEAPQAEGGVHNRGFAGIIGTLAQMPRQLPYEKMRQSTNVSDFSRATPPTASVADLLAGRFQPNADYERRMQRGDPVIDPISVAAGISDIRPRGAKGFQEGGQFVVPDDEDPFERAAARRRSEVAPRPRSTGLESLASAMVPQSPLDWALMGLGGPGGKAAKTAAVALGGALTSDEAEAGPLALIKKGIRAFHASPHEFDKFDMSKIGTGEGAQSYGRGLYFAEKEDVAKNYRESFQERTKSSVKGVELPKADSLLGRSLRLDIESILEAKKTGAGERWLPEWTDRVEKIVDAVKRYPLSGESKSQRDLVDFYEKHVRDATPNNITMQKGPSHMYEVNIRADPETILDYEKKVKYQTPKVQERVSGLFKGYPKEELDLLRPGDLYGGELIGLFGHNLPREMRGVDIPGLKYLDQFSRSKGEGTSNYVMFRDDIIDILRKYGLAGLAAGPALRPREER